MQPANPTWSLLKAECCLLVWFVRLRLYSKGLEIMCVARHSFWFTTFSVSFSCLTSFQLDLLRVHWCSLAATQSQTDWTCIFSRVSCFWDVSKPLCCDYSRWQWLVSQLLHVLWNFSVRPLLMSFPLGLIYTPETSAFISPISISGVSSCGHRSPLPETSLNICMSPSSNTTITRTYRNHFNTSKVYLVILLCFSSFSFCLLLLLSLLIGGALLPPGGVVVVYVPWHVSLEVETWKDEWRGC